MPIFKSFLPIRYLPDRTYDQKLRLNAELGLARFVESQAVYRCRQCQKWVAPHGVPIDVQFRCRCVDNVNLP